MKLKIPKLTKELDLCITVLEQGGHILERTSAGEDGLYLIYPGVSETRIRRSSLQVLIAMACVSYMLRQPNNDLLYASKISID